MRDDGGTVMVEEGYRALSRQLYRARIESQGSPRVMPLRPHLAPLQTRRLETSAGGIGRRGGVARGSTALCCTDQWPGRSPRPAFAFMRGEGTLAGSIMATTRRLAAILAADVAGYSWLDPRPWIKGSAARRTRSPTQQPPVNAFWSLTMH